MERWRCCESWGGGGGGFSLYQCQSPQILADILMGPQEQNTGEERTTRELEMQETDQ